MTIKQSLNKPIIKPIIQSIISKPFIDPNDNRFLNTEPRMSIAEDRNFDPITEHFSKKVYGGLKGEIRLAILQRDLTLVVERLSSKLGRPLRILDVGAGLAQLSILFAKQGHEVTVNDISSNMLAQAQKSAIEQGVYEAIRWFACPYQDLDGQLDNQLYKQPNSEQMNQPLVKDGPHLNNHSFDLVLCHALLEWLGNPQDIMPHFTQWLTPEGCLSLCFYNPASFVYRNLIMGNFNLLNKPDYQADTKKSLTPNNPVAYEQVEHWLQQAGFRVDTVSGLRVFHDYAPLKRGGHTDSEAVIAMELRYSTQAPYKWLGRYLHLLAYPAND